MPTVVYLPAMVAHKPLVRADPPDPPVTALKFLCNALGVKKPAACSALASSRVGIAKPGGDLGCLREVLDPAELVYPCEDIVTLDGHPIAAYRNRKPIVVALHKPEGLDVGRTDKKVASEAKDRRGCFVQWLNEICGEVGVPRLYSIGRLDKDTSGLLLATDDGDLCYACCRPGQLSKTYIAVSRLRVKLATEGKDRPGSHEEAVAALKRQAKDAVSQLATRPVVLQDGPVHIEHAELLNFTVQQREIPAHLLQHGGSKRRSRRGETNRTEISDATPLLLAEAEITLSVTVRVGRFRVVRRAIAAVGLPVFRLHRSAFGPFQLKETNGGTGAEPWDILIAPSSHMLLSEAYCDQLWHTLFGDRRRCGVADGQVAALQAREALLHDARLSQWLSEFSRMFVPVDTDKLRGGDDDEDELDDDNEGFVLSTCSTGG